MSSTRNVRRFAVVRGRGLTVTCAVAVALLTTPLSAGIAEADPVSSGQSANGQDAPSFLRIDVVDADGAASGSYVDTRYPGRTITVTPKFHNLAVSGQTSPNAEVTISAVVDEFAGIVLKDGRINHDASGVIERQVIKLPYVNQAVDMFLELKGLPGESQDR